MEELEGIGSLEDVSGSPLLESLNEEARLGAGARSDLLARYEDASAEVSTALLLCILTEGFAWVNLLNCFCLPIMDYNCPVWTVKDFFCFQWNSPAMCKKWSI